MFFIDKKNCGRKLNFFFAPNIKIYNIHKRRDSPSKIYQAWIICTYIYYIYILFYILCIIYIHFLPPHFFSRYFFQLLASCYIGPGYYTIYSIHILFYIYIYKYIYIYIFIYAYFSTTWREIIFFFHLCTMVREFNDHWINEDKIKFKCR